MAACVGTRDDEELKELFDNAESFDLSFFSNNTVAEFVKHFISTGTLHDARVLQMRLKRLLGNATFLQAFQHSGLPLALICCASILSLTPWGVRVQTCSQFMYLESNSNFFSWTSWSPTAFFSLGQAVPIVIYQL